ncbi:MAG: flotillin-like FloA family protein [Phycisphaerae bacterium]|nr:flotillin-like FloA family protein [Phycisphaerae bacterium]
MSQPTTPGAMARARETEMRALVEGNRAKVVENEVRIPPGVAESFRRGRIGILDLRPMRNGDADKTVRGAIGGTGEHKAEPPKV